MESLQQKAPRQDLYNTGFWTHPASGSDVLTCTIEALSYDLGQWDGRAG